MSIHARFGFVVWLSTVITAPVASIPARADQSSEHDGLQVSLNESLELKTFDTAQAPEGVWKPAVTPECGANSLYVMLRLLDFPANRQVLRTRVPITGDGASLLQLKDEAVLQGLDVANYETTAAGLAGYKLPLVARMSSDAQNPRGHYVVVTQIDDEMIRVIDGSTGHSVRMNPATFSEAFSGHVLAARPSVWPRIFRYAVVLILAVELFFLVKLGSPLVRRRWSRAA